MYGPPNEHLFKQPICGSPLFLPKKGRVNWREKSEKEAVGDCPAPPPFSMARDGCPARKPSGKKLLGG